MELQIRAEEECIPLNIPVYKQRNLLYTIIMSLFVALFPLAAVSERAIASGESTLGILSIIWIWMFIIGCGEFSRLSKIGKEVERVKAELAQKEASKSSDSDWKETLLGIGLVILIVVLCVVFPPLLIILMLIKAIMSAVPKFKWLSANKRYFLYGFLLNCYLFFMAAMSTVLCNDKSTVSSYRWLVSILFFVITFILLGGIMRNHTYQTLRTISTIPVMIFMILLPFALVGIMAYAMYSEDSSVTGVEAVGVHEVEGHLRHLSNGTVVYVRPHLRTNPDGILTNNFSYHG